MKRRDFVYGGTVGVISGLAGCAGLPSEFTHNKVIRFPFIETNRIQFSLSQGIEHTFTNISSVSGRILYQIIIIDEDAEDEILTRDGEHKRMSVFTEENAPPTIYPIGEVVVEVTVSDNERQTIELDVDLPSLRDGERFEIVFVPLTVQTEVENIGKLNGSTSVYYIVEDTILGETEVEIEGGNSETVTVETEDALYDVRYRDTMRTRISETIDAGVSE